MLHTRADASSFERKRQIGEPAGVVASRHGSAHLAEAYIGWPNA